MSKYSHSGEFGSVEHFTVNIPTMEFHSTNRIINAGWHKVNDLYQISRSDGVDCGLMIFTLSGKGKITLGRKTSFATSGSIAVIPPHCYHSYGCVPKGEWEFYWCHYCGDHAIHSSNDIVKNGEFLFQFDEKLIRRFWSDYIDNKAKGIERELEDSAWLERFFQILLKKSVAASCIGNDRQMVQEMLIFMEQSKDSDFSLDVLAKHFHYSKEHLIRVFQKVMGISPYKYWVLIKLNHSCYELEKSERSIAEIARMCGYKHVGSYSVEFKKIFNISPQEYRDVFQLQKGKNE